jgi:protocatechuate 3,4-dioxygenase alpha subunit
MSLKETASQTAGPYLHIGMAPEAAGIDTGRNERPNLMARDGCQGERIRVEGIAYDGLGAPIKDALIEFWQADAAGAIAGADDPRGLSPDPHFTNWGRCPASFEDGLWWFETVKPGPLPGPGGSLQAPCIDLLLFARGVNIHLLTRIYFGDEAEANAADPTLRRIESAARRQTLVAERRERDGRAVYRFDIKVQGEGETVFFDL